MQIDAKSSGWLMLVYTATCCPARPPEQAGWPSATAGSTWQRCYDSQLFAPPRSPKFAAATLTWAVSATSWPWKAWRRCRGAAPGGRCTYAENSHCRLSGLPRELASALAHRPSCGGSPPCGAGSGMLHSASQRVPCATCCLVYLPPTPCAGYAAQDSHLQVWAWSGRSVPLLRVPLNSTTCSAGRGCTNLRDLGGRQQALRRLQPAAPGGFVRQLPIRRQEQQRHLVMHHCCMSAAPGWPLCCMHADYCRWSPDAIARPRTPLILLQCCLRCCACRFEACSHAAERRCQHWAHPRMPKIRHSHDCVK